MTDPFWLAISAIVCMLSLIGICMVWCKCGTRSTEPAAGEGARSLDMASTPGMCTTGKCTYEQVLDRLVAHNVPNAWFFAADIVNLQPYPNGDYTRLLQQLRAQNTDNAIIAHILEALADA